MTHGHEGHMHDNGVQCQAEMIANRDGAWRTAEEMFDDLVMTYEEMLPGVIAKLAPEGCELNDKILCLFIVRSVGLVITECMTRIQERSQEYLKNEESFNALPDVEKVKMMAVAIFMTTHPNGLQTPTVPE